MDQHSQPPSSSGPKPVFDWAACGSPAQYKKHQRHGVPMCEACRAAENRRSAGRHPAVNVWLDRRPWTEEEDMIATSGGPLIEIALRLGRSYSSVKNRRGRLRELQKISSPT